MDGFKKSGFTELQEIEPINTEHRPSEPPLKDVDVALQVDDALDVVPIDERWSWNPLDWFRAIKKEITEVNFELTEKKRVMYRAVAGEGLVSFLFFFIVMATAVNNGRQESPENLVLGALSTALCSVALIYSFADVSGAHFNPAVTFATIVTGKTSVRKGIAYIGVQLFASVFATLALMVVFPGVGNGPVTAIPAFVVVTVNDSAKLVNAFFMEFILTFILVYVIFATAFDTVDTKAVKINANGTKSGGQNMTIYTTSGNTKGGFAPIAIGFTLGFLGLIGGSVSGGAFNPARAFGPALVSGAGWKHHWVYWAGDLLGAALAGYAQSFFAHEPVQHSAAVPTKQTRPVAAQ